MLLEMATSQALDQLGIPHNHNDWDSYAKEQGSIDIITEEYFIECKNWTEKSHRNLETLRREVINRYPESSNKKLLLISWLSNNLIFQLNSVGISTINLGFVCTGNSYSFTVRLLIDKLKFMVKTKIGRNEK